MEQFNAACLDSVRIMEGSLEKAQFWATHAAVSLSPTQTKTIKALLDAGPGGFEGGHEHEQICQFVPGIDGRGFPKPGSTYQGWLAGSDRAGQVRALLDQYAGLEH